MAARGLSPFSSASHKGGPSPFSTFLHIALGVPQIQQLCDSLRAQGVAIVREPGPMQHGTTVIAFLEDPDGYEIELIEERSRA